MFDDLKQHLYEMGARERRNSLRMLTELLHDEVGGPASVLQLLAEVCESRSEYGRAWEKAAEKLDKLAGQNWPTLDER